MIRDTSFWHPFSDLGSSEQPLVITDGEGSWVADQDGRRYLDATANLWCCNVGHGRKRLADAAASQMLRLGGYHAYGRFSNQPAEELGRLLAALAPFEDARAFLTMGGSDSIDTALKLTRRYWDALGEPQRTVVVVREDAYHGMHSGGTSLSGIAVNLTGFGPLVREVVVVDRHDPAAFAAVLEERGTEVAAFLGEPVMGAGGVHPPSEGYWPEIERLCRANGALLICDEVVTGFGRLGHWFGVERFGITPDIIICAKGLTSGYLPLGATICGPRVQQPFRAAGGPVFRHGYTYSGHPVGCAVALENLAILEEEDLVGRVATIEPEFSAAMRGLGGHPLVTEVRTCGLLAGLDVADGAADAVAAAALEGGLVVRALLGRTIQVSPPFVITADEIRELTCRLAAALDAVHLPAAAVRAASEPTVPAIP